MAKPNRRTVLALGTSAAAVALLGAKDGKSLLGKKEQPLKVDETIGDLAYVRSVGEQVVEGVGLVIGLEGTGSEPEKSQYREKLLAEMRAARVEYPERVLASRDRSLVLVRAKIPVGITKDDLFDATIELTAGSSTLSLAGGQLLLTKLSQVGYIDGIAREGQSLAYAGGPIVTGTSAEPDNLKVGRVLGGARVKKDQPYLMVLKENRKSVRTSALVQSVIGARFFQLDGIEQKGMAEAKNDEYLELRVPKTYHQNQSRYFQVAYLLHVVDTPELRAKRMERWAAELLDPATAGMTALRLEGVGRNSIETLKKGLTSSDPSVRFFAAEALAYLNDASGVDVLADAVMNRSDYRAFALAALSATDQAASLARLRQLLSVPDVEIRYGAFNALRTADENDVFLGKTRVIEDQPVELPDDEEDAMALQIATARARAKRPKDPFTLYVVDSDGPPMIHVSNSRRSEIVIFGRQQKLLPPLVLGDPGSVLVNAGINDQEAQISRLPGTDLDAPTMKTSSPLEVSTIIQNAANLGATYPQILALLRMAEKQKNLEGALAMDALPQPSDNYAKAQLAGQTDGTAKKDAAVGRTGGSSKSARPRLFDKLRNRGREKEKAASKSRETEAKTKAKSD